MNGPLLQVEHLVKRFGGLTATDRCTLEVASGELHALIGPNGAGKTTLINQLAGALQPDTGRILLAGDDITRWSAAERLHAGLARSFQITSLYPDWTARDNVALAVQGASGSSFRFWRPQRAEAVLYERADALLAQVGLAGQAATPAGRLSHGEQRALEVALALASRPRLLLLDEPMAGMGPAESARLVDLLAQLKGEYTMLLIEHDMDAVFRLADRVSVLVAGRVIASGTPDEIRAHPEVKAAYLGDEYSERQEIAA